MSLTLRRVVATAGATALIAGAAIVAAPPAQADGGYYGSWTLAAVKIAGDRVDCPGKLPLPPPTPAIECKVGETLKLKSDYTYKTSGLTGGEANKGEFEVIKFSTNDYRTIIFDSYDVKDNPSSYQVKFQGKTSAGTYKKMVIFLTYNTPSGEDLKISMILHRDGK
jgi:hypothetical protein